MSKYALVAVGITAVLLTGTAPGGDACAVAASSDHACCVEQVHEPASACCSTTSVPASSTADERGSRCDCIHPASTPAAMVPSSSPPSPEKALCTAPNHHALPSDELTDTSARTTAQVRNHAPPPVFLLDCAFLI
jgi:hypothetical protein